MMCNKSRSHIHIISMTVHKTLMRAPRAYCLSQLFRDPTHRHLLLVWISLLKQSKSFRLKSSNYETPQPRTLDDMETREDNKITLLTPNVHSAMEEDILTMIAGGTVKAA